MATLVWMKPLSADTPLEVERIWLEEIRKRGPSFQIQRLIELSDLCRQAAREAIRRAYPEASPAEADEILLRELYGDEVDARKAIELRRQRGFYDQP
ncbi:MAG TPA: hypothetical protein VFR03_12730 [Thermoanaerobaculia bacterium]|nr:hypothetical protein [Thermoanaerobaculia bacterium]